MGGNGELTVPAKSRLPTEFENSSDNSRNILISRFTGADDRITYLLQISTQYISVNQHLIILQIYVL